MTEDEKRKHEKRAKEIDEEVAKILEKTKTGNPLTLHDKWKIDSLRLSQSIILEKLKNAN